MNSISTDNGDTSPAGILDRRIVDTLRDQADAASVDTGRLLTGATRLGRVRRLRRRLALAAGAGATVLAGAMAAVVLVVPGGITLPWTGDREPAGSGRPMPPPAPIDVPGAMDRPDLVGTDPRLLHFTVDPGRARYDAWHSATGTGAKAGVDAGATGIETVRLDLGDHRLVVVGLARSPEGLETAVFDGAPYGPTEVPRSAFGTAIGVAGAQVERVPPAGPGGSPGWILRWRPVDGLWARAAGFGPDDTAVRAAVAALRLDVATRCVVPFRLNALPVGARVTACSAKLTGFPRSLDASLLVEGAAGQRMEVQVQYAPGKPMGRRTGNRTVGGRSAYLYPDNSELELLGNRDVYLSVRYGKAHSGFGAADAELVLASLDLAPRIADLAGWPTH